MYIEDIVEGLALRVVRHTPLQVVLEAKDAQSVTPLVDVLRRHGYRNVCADLTRSGWYVYACPSRDSSCLT
jgi:hypothetical protein